jgi:hypothetical protein
MNTDTIEKPTNTIDNTILIVVNWQEPVFQIAFCRTGRPKEDYARSQGIVEP